MRFTTKDIDVAVNALGRDGLDGPLETISIAEAIGFEATLAQRPYSRLRTVPGAVPPPRLPADREGRSNGVPLLIRHEDDDVCCELWCAA